MSKHIDELLLDSGLFPNKRKPKQQTNNFDFSKDTILITGAAGSIGCELTRQLVNTPCKKLILIDIAESSLYDLIKELEFENINHVEFLILNITEEIALRHLFETYHPTIVFHTAAYKHVPLMEENPYEAIKLNILGTKLLADLATDYQVVKFIFISTDKAVNPISVMGMSKFIAENYLNELSKKHKTTFLITRFGNIIGSNGSALPLFIKQIETNNILTITSELATRFFINKQKACNLILKIAISHTKSNILTFNMGQPIKLISLVERILLLYENPNKNINIQITGLRPGEKLHEDITNSHEYLSPTEDDDIFEIKSTNNETKIIDFTALQLINPYMDNAEIKSILRSYL